MAQPEQARFIRRRQTWERERSALNPILQLLHPLPASRALTVKLMEETSTRIDADPRQHADGPASRFFNYAQKLFGMLYLHQQGKDMLFPDLMRRIRKIPVGPLYEHALAKMFSASNIPTLKKQSIESLIAGTYLLDDGAERHEVLRSLQISVFSGDYEKRLQLIRAIPDQQDKDRLIASFILKGEGYIDVMLSLYGIELLDMVQDREIRRDLCDILGGFHDPEHSLIALLESGNAEEIDQYLSDAPSDHESATAVLKHAGKLDPAASRRSVRDILDASVDEPRERYALLWATVKNEAYRHLPASEADVVIEELITSTHVSSIARVLPLIGKISDLRIRDALFDRYSVSDNSSMQLALLDATMQSPAADRAPRILQYLDRLLAGRLDADEPYRIMPLLFGDDGKAVASHDGLPQQIIARFLQSDDPRFQTLAPELVRLIPDPAARDAAIEAFCGSEHAELAFHGTCLKVAYAETTEEAQALRPMMLRWLQAGYCMNGHAYDVKKMFSLLFSTPSAGPSGQGDGIDDIDPSLLLRQSSTVHNALTEFLIDEQSAPHYEAMLENLADARHYDLPAMILSRMSLKIEIAGAEEITFAEKLADVHRGFAAPYPQHMPITVMAEGLIEFWDTSANLDTLKTGHAVFEEALSRQDLSEFLDPGSKGMHELEALCLLTSLIDPASVKRAVARAEETPSTPADARYDGSELRVVLTSYQKFLGYALKPESYTKFAMAKDEAFDEPKMRAFLEKERGTILKAMIIFKNGIVYEALRRKKEKFADFLGRIDKLMYHPDVFAALHSICHSADSNKRSGADYAYRLLALTDNFLQANQKGVLLDALDEFKAADAPFAERNLRFAFRYLSSQYPLWGLGSTLSEDDFKRIVGILDMSHIHLLGPAFRHGNFRLQGDAQARLRNILSETLRGTFDDWVAQDPDISAANRRTEVASAEAFPGRPSAFDAWNKGDTEMLLEGSNGHQYRLATWKRQPGVDLFLGSKVGICTALDGENPSAILEALIFQVVQQFELTDAETRETMGSCMMFFSKAEGYDTPVLIVDHIALNRYLTDDLTMRDGIISWMRKFSQQVAGFEAPIFMGKNLNYVTLDGLDESKDLTLSVIGDTDNHLLYANALDRYDGWTDISQAHTRNLFVLYEPDGGVQ